MIRRLRIKFICTNMVIFTVMLAVIFATVFHFTMEGMKRQSLRTLTESGILHGVSDKMPGRPKAVVMSYFSALISPDGTVTLCENEYFENADTEQVRTLVSLAQKDPDRAGVLQKYRLRYEKTATPQGLKIFFLDVSVEFEMMKALFRTCLVIALVSFVAFLGISIFLARWAVRPVEAAWNQQKQFVADASHELKTPLSVIMTNAELLQEPDYDTAQARQFSQNILVMSRQMRGLVERLLELARVDTGSLNVSFQKLDLSELISDTLLLFEPVYFENGLTLTSQIHPLLHVSGSLSHLRQVIEILLDNGIKYSTPGGTVRVTLSQLGNRCLLCVSSPGQPLSREDLKNIFKRFYRMDAVRSRDGSYGLGLSIAESIIQSHGGRIWAESRDGVNSFLILLPLGN